MRTTRRRTALMDLLQNSDRFQCAQELHSTLSKQGESLALSTVYRALQQFVESGEVDVFHSNDGEARYRRCHRTDHHCHLICRSCGRTEELNAEAISSWAAELSRDLGFADVFQVTEIVGGCKDCAG